MIHLGKSFFRILLLIILLPLASSVHAEVKLLPFLRIAASASMTIPLTALIRQYQQTHAVTISVFYDSTFTLADRILEDSEPVPDMIIGESSLLLQKLASKKRFYETLPPVPLVANKLAITTSKHRHFSIPASIQQDPKALLIFLSNRSFITIADPEENTLGSFSQSLLQNLGLWRKLHPMLIRTPNSALNLYLIAKGNTVGITYLTDTYHNPEVTLLHLFSESLQPEIIYYGAILKGRHDILKEAENFLKFLSSPSSLHLLGTYGFVPVKK